MKRMVKNGDLIDVESDGTITVAGKPVGGGSDYTAGSNIEISEAKEISLKNDITGINSFKFEGEIAPTIGSYGGVGLKIKSNSDSFQYPPIYLFSYWYDESQRKYLDFVFYTDFNTTHTTYLDAKGFADKSYFFLTKGGKVPAVPSSDGTYVLKATVSGGAVTYAWIAQ